MFENIDLYTPIHGSHVISLTLRVSVNANQSLLEMPMDYGGEGRLFASNLESAVHFFLASFLLLFVLLLRCIGRRTNMLSSRSNYSTTLNV